MVFQLKIYKKIYANVINNNRKFTEYRDKVENLMKRFSESNRSVNINK